MGRFHADSNPGQPAADEALRAFEARLAQLVSATQDALVFMDSRERISSVNPSGLDMFGYRLDELVGQPVEVLMPEPYAGRHHDYVRRYLETGETRAIGTIREVQAKRKDGEVFPIELSVTRIATDGGVSYAAFIRDVSERDRLRRQLVDRERLAAVGTTAAKLAHEIGNPLNNLSLHAQLVERRLRKLELYDEVLDSSTRSLRTEISRLARLLEDFRSLSKREEPQLCNIDLRALIEDIVALQRPGIEAQGIELTVELAGDLPAVCVDRDKITQVVVNLVKNALEAMDDAPPQRPPSASGPTSPSSPPSPSRRGRLVIGAGRVQNGGGRVWARIRVRDTGPGIPHDLDVFAPFTTTKKGGTGLGLAVARQLVAAHGGQLDCTSEVGVGTEFVLDLPLAGEGRAR